MSWIMKWPFIFRTEEANLFCQRSTYQGRSICNTLAWWQCWLMSVNWKTLCAFIPLYWPTFAEAAIFSSASLLYTRTISHKSLHLSFLVAQDRTNQLLQKRERHFINNPFFKSLFHRPVIFSLDKVKSKHNFIIQAWAYFIWNYSNLLFLSQK